MDFLLDESADFRLGKYLSNLGHNVVSIVKDYPRSLSDAQVFAISLDQNRILITEDKDFISIISTQTKSFPGIVLFNLGTKDDLTLKCNLVDKLLIKVTKSTNILVLVTSANLHIRQLKVQRVQS
jgi:predicted nuclease of predicted toxin-antitoxin system